MIVVVGAGIVGVTTALELKRRGEDVILIDRADPGQETSFGNAGVLSEASIIVSNNPKIKTILTKMLLRRDPSLLVDIKFILSNFSWMLKFLKYCNEDHMRHAANALRKLHALSMPIHKDLLDESKATKILNNGGWLKVYRSQNGIDQSLTERNFLKEMGVDYTVYSRAELERLEPSLNPIFHGGLLINDACSVSSPIKLTQAYFKLFENLGGVFKKGEVQDFYQNMRSQWTVVLANGDEIEASELVIATGPWASDTLRGLGYNIPMAWERGYHVQVSPGKRGMISRPFHDVEGGYVMSPLENNMVRLLTGVEIAHRNAKPNYKQIKRAVKVASAAYDFKANPEEIPWLGSRPTLADSLPMVGPAPKHKRLWFNFGHQHIGMLVSTGCAYFLADQLLGTVSNNGLDALLPSRFVL